MNSDDYHNAKIGRIGADRMSLGLSIIPCKNYGDMEKVRELIEQRDRLAEEVGQLKSRLTQTMGAVTISRNGYVQELEQQRDRLAEALKDHMSALGLALKDYMSAFEQRDRLALKDYMSAFGQGLEAHGIPMGEQQVEADANARKAIQSLTPNEL